MRLTFSVTQAGGTHRVNVVKVGDKKIFPVPVYLSMNKEKTKTVYGALTSGLLTKITTVIMKAGG